MFQLIICTTFYKTRTKIALVFETCTKKLYFQSSNHNLGLEAKSLLRINLYKEFIELVLHPAWPTYTLLRQVYVYVIRKEI